MTSSPRYYHDDDQEKKGMAPILHPPTGYVIGDPDKVPLAGLSAVDESPLDAVLGNLILSASGWRTVFARDGAEESGSAEIGWEREAIAASAASVFAAYLKAASGAASPLVLLGMDARPTGPAIADVMARAFLAEGCRVRCLFIVAAPEIMAYARAAGSLPESDEEKAHGFAYVSASHNPIGHNGLKFGLVDGGVVPGSEASKLIAAFKEKMARKDRVSAAAALVAAADRTALARAYSGAAQAKRRSNSAYALFTREVVAGTPDAAAQDRFLDRIVAGVRDRPLGVVADFNGSARAVALDVDILTGLGIKVDVMNGQAGRIAHRIVPEGESLEPCRRRLEELHAADPSYVIGYVPDCDGDRGNVVFWDEAAGAARSLEAQEVFALCCVAELAHQARDGSDGKPAVAVNDPTSMRVDAIARAFGAATFRAEVGEANVVGLARRLRTEGYAVRILGEGAAGGNITHPSAVRDPIDTVFALLKLLSVRSDASGKGLFESWCEKSGKASAYRADFGLSDVIATLPAFRTTSAYESEAILKIRTADHALLKDRYQAIFLREWETRKASLRADFGIEAWEAIAYLGTEERRRTARFSEAGKGGLKILFTDAAGTPVAYIWMRGSGTEPVFRVMADVAGSDPAAERELLAWQRAMITEADAAS